MGSSKPPNPDMPFGSPAPGPSLLDDSESKFLESFFEGVSSDHFNFDFFNTNNHDGGQMGMGWEELPPAFMGTSVTFGQQSQHAGPSNELSRMSFADMHLHPHTNMSGPSNMSAPPPPAPAAPPIASADVMAAASVLQNGANARSHSLGSEALFGNHDLTSPTHTTNNHNHIRPQSISHYPPSAPTLDRPRDNFMRDTLYTEMMFGPNHAGPERMMRPKPVPQKVDIRWGSDSGFGSPQGFIPPPNTAKLEESERSRLQALDAFIGAALTESSSADNTQPSSPTITRTVPIVQPPRRSSTVVKEEPHEPPRKRRKSKFSEETAEEDDESSAPSKPDGRRKRKSQSKADSPVIAPSNGSAGHKRRKSTTAAAAQKATRENLTEDQKRENHIKSEQKRRTLIREGFEDLGELVPGLRGGGFSKSAVLVMAADWLEELLRGNEVLRGKIEEVRGGG
ncbi:BHLH family transcription factor protein [Rutstroemia sp. NJR-2017a WRK4]|nr:BHLH family transcription factor protein [Rutstroemia sp. NJR-2017a WRK4]